MEAVKITFSKRFWKAYTRLKDDALRERIQKQLRKALENPEIGKPLSYSLKGLRTLRVDPYRIIYAVEGETLEVIALGNRDDVYE